MVGTLTGKWKGFFSQRLGTKDDPYVAEFDFEMDLVESNGTFEGTCRDMEIEIGQNEKSRIKGFRDGLVISFTKQYDNSIYYNDEKDELILDKERTPDEITYYGTFDSEENKFSGKWEIVLDEEAILEGHEYEIHVEYGHWEMKRM